MIAIPSYLLTYLRNFFQAWFYAQPHTVVGEFGSDQYPTSNDCTLEVHFLRAAEVFLAQHGNYLSPDDSESSSQLKYEKIFNLSMGRFKIWWELFDDNTKSDPFEGKFLPPLDILMVWHAYILSPIPYLKDCRRWSKMILWNHAFPLKLINDCIGTSDFNFEAPEEFKRHFTNVTGLDYEIPRSSIDLLVSSLEAASPNAHGIDLGENQKLLLDEYEDRKSKPWSVDMLHTLSTHCNFIRSGGDISWTTKTFGMAILSVSRQRYLRFLLLHDRYPKEYFVPTWDIDLVWHTHQLWPSEYRRHHSKILGEMLDHDVTAEGDGSVREWKLRTAELWKKEFSEPLPLCFCDECNAQRQKTS